MEQTTQIDRYISFCGIECDKWADELCQHLKERIEQGCSRQWQDYFSKKLEEQSRMQHDNLFFVGSQMNNLYSFFEEVGDEKMLDYIYKLEQECC